LNLRTSLSIVMTLWNSKSYRLHRVVKDGDCGYIFGIHPICRLREKQKVTIFGGFNVSRLPVQTKYLWISRDYLWISPFRCGKVSDRLESRQNVPPHIWMDSPTRSNIWIGVFAVIFVENTVDKFSRFFPQGQEFRLTESSPISGHEMRLCIHL
jgi:hypothetical protein